MIVPIHAWVKGQAIELAWERRAWEQGYFDYTCKPLKVSSIITYIHLHVHVYTYVHITSLMLECMYIWRCCNYTHYTCVTCSEFLSSIHTHWSWLPEEPVCCSFYQTPILSDWVFSLPRSPETQMMSNQWQQCGFCVGIYVCATKRVGRMGGRGRGR